MSAIQTALNNVAPGGGMGGGSTVTMTLRVDASPAAEYLKASAEAIAEAREKLALHEDGVHISPNEWRRLLIGLLKVTDGGRV